MNLEQQQHQIIHAKNITTSTISEYANINICDGTPLFQAASALPPPPQAPLATSSSNASIANATFVTIGMLSAPLPHHSTHTTISPSSTSTFKTPLLPMPSLEDIEGSLQLAPQSTMESEQTLTMQPQHQQQPIPGGILKYPPPPAVTNTITVGIPLGLGPGPPLQTTLLNSDQQQQAFPSPPLVMPPTTLSHNDCSTSLVQGVGTGILRNSNTSTPAMATNINMGNVNTSTVAASGCGNKAPVKSNLVGGTTATSNSNLRQKPVAAQRKCCCCCFGGKQSSSILNGKKSTGNKHKRKTHTFWSALLTNLGICALLLAYTLLGSFIFLTIESEDSMLLQRTLASTKRVPGNGGGGSSTNINRRGMRTKSVNNYNSNNNLYHNQLQQTQEHVRLDNGTLTATAAAAASSLSSYAAASSSSSLLQAQLSSSSSLPSYSSAAVLEGIVPLTNVNGGVDGAPIGGHNDYIYTNDNDVDDDDGLAVGGYVGADVDGTASQLAISADTYDVRQRTIENIWDITVSLNILYKENWTKLAALEIAKFQDQLIKRLNEDTLLQLSHDIDDGNGAAAGVAANGNSPATEAVLLHSHHHYNHHHHLHHYHHSSHEWNFARAFLYSLTVLTTIGYGNIAPRTTLGRLVTLAYAIFGIPLTLVYLSSTGGLLAKVAREVFSKALCCCLCSNCGYCCYDERRMAEKERRTKRKRQQEELRKQQASMQEPYYVRSGSMTESRFQTPEKQPSTPVTVQLPDIDSLSASESRGSMHGLSILAPILLCLSMMIIYIVFGALVLYRLEEWPLLDGIYFCFMSLSTIGFGDMLPSLRRESTTTTWFCSIYIMSGMALTAMCFNVIHEEIVHRIRIVVEFKQANSNMDSTNDEQHVGASGGVGGGCYVAT